MTIAFFEIDCMGGEELELLSLAVAPVFICLVYIFIRDKYEKEPLYLLFTGVVYGVVITAPIVMAENFVTIFIPNGGLTVEAFYLAFIVASLVEEAFKVVILYFLIWHNKNLNEPFDGIVYAVFIALGFAGVENILYVFNTEFGGLSTAIGRGIFSVPAHGIFGVAMGFYFALAKFEPAREKRYIFLAFAIPWFIHGLYDFILLANMPYMMAVFAAFIAYLWYFAYGKMKTHLAASPFKPQ